MFGRKKEAAPDSITIDPDEVRWRRLIPAAGAGIILQPPRTPAAAVDVSNFPVGAKVGHLTQIGTLWLDVDALEMVDFSPRDGCGCELQFRHGTTRHLTIIEAACLQKYFTQQQAEVAELERIGCIPSSMQLHSSKTPQADT